MDVREKTVTGMAEYIEREAAIKELMNDAPEQVSYSRGDAADCIRYMDAADVEKMSDGYHTFADLYEQRLILSAALAKNNPNAWKSKRHEDGRVPFGGGWFIMGFDTDEGCYTYHYELKDWDLFQCKELDKGKPWDGHTSKDVRRLLSIPADDVAPVRHGRWEPGNPICPVCGGNKFKDLDADIWCDWMPDFCPNCGAEMDGGAE